MTLLEIARQEAAIRSAYYGEKQSPGRLPPGTGEQNRFFQADTVRFQNVLKHIRAAKDGIGSNDLHRIIGGSYSTLRYDIRLLESKGIIAREGNHKGGKWRVVGGM